MHQCYDVFCILINGLSETHLGIERYLKFSFGENNESATNRVKVRIFYQ